jgi:hypothetical protein
MKCQKNDIVPTVTDLPVVADVSSTTVEHENL